ncbi:MAG: DNA adenine methylase [Fusobacteriaceae bacterium]|nr:DNA adenine methylase [Fusobacteriaceae bacterium]
MNYIGSKLSLLNFIEESISDLMINNNDTRNLDEITFADLFAGTGIVGYYFKTKGSKIIANDIQYYSYVLNKNAIETNKQLEFVGLFNVIKELKNCDLSIRKDMVLKYLENINGTEGFIFHNYSESGIAKRLYFSEENGKKCDSIREIIESWNKSNYINSSEYFFLKAALIESIDKVANTASVYGAFLKNIKRTAQASLKMIPYLSIFDNKKDNKVYNEDVNNLIGKLSGDILYLDPPYNHRQYSSNYHLLETIAKYDNPLISGKTGLRDSQGQKSLYCSKPKAVEAFEDLVMKSKFKYILLSYNDEGIIPLNEIERIFNKKGKYIQYNTEYKRFKADKDESRNHLKSKTTEYLHCCIVND